MNYVILQEGESMFLGPNVPHAYIFGGMFTIARFSAPLCVENADGKVNVCGGDIVYNKPTAGDS